MKARIVTLLAVAATGLATPDHVSAQISVDAEVAAAIVDKMPQDPTASFDVDVGRVFCWTRVIGASGTEIQHVWIHGEMEFPVTVAIGGSPWRTWTSKVIPPEWAGDWRVEIRDGDGNLLDTRSFTVGG